MPVLFLLGGRMAFFVGVRRGWSFVGAAFRRPLVAADLFGFTALCTGRSFDEASPVELSSQGDATLFSLTALCTGRSFDEALPVELSS